MAKIFFDKNASRINSSLIQLLGGYTLTVISLVQGFLLIPLYLSYIQTELFGFWVTVNSIVVILSIIDFGVSPIIVPIMSKLYAQKDFGKLISYFINGTYINIIICIIFLLICIPLAPNLDYFLSIDKKYLAEVTLCFYLAVTIMILTIINQSLIDFCNSIMKPLFQICIRVLGQLIGVISIIFLLIFENGIISIPVGLLLCECFLFICLMLYIKSKLLFFPKNFRLDNSIIYSIILKIGHMIRANIGGKLVENSPNLIITYFIGAESTTMYYILKKISDLIMRLIRIFATSILSTYSNLLIVSTHEKVQIVTHHIVFIGLLSSLNLTSLYVIFNLDFISLWLPNIFIPGLKIVILIGLFTFFYSLFEILKFLHFSIGSYDLPAKLNLWAGISAGITSIISTPYLGIIAIPLSFFLCITFAAIKLLRSLIMKKYICISTDLIYRIIILFTILLLFIYGYSYINFELNLINFILVFVITLLTISTLNIIIFYNEFSRIRNFLKGLN